MKKKIYTRSHNIDLLKQVDNNGAQFTAEEHAYVTSKEFKDRFESKESLIKWQLELNASRLQEVVLLVEHMYKNEFKNVISFGAGTCFMEYLLKVMLPKDSFVIATDFDSFYIEKARMLFPEIISTEFDFLKDDISSIKNITNVDLDVAVFFGSAYVMDDMQLVHLFKKLKEIKIKQIIDFHGGYMSFWDVVYEYLLPLRKSSFLSRVFRKPLNKGEYIGKFHGYSRSRDELRRLYKESGVDLVKEISMDSCKYVAICNC